jgi:hypothetical protein
VHSYISYNCEVFPPGVLNHGGSLPGYRTPSAWPPTRGIFFAPSLVWIGYTDSKDDALVKQVSEASALRLRQKAVSLGQAAAAPGYLNTAKYANYAGYWTNSTELFGSNLPILKTIQKKYDPKGVMSLAGGYKL